ncbi:MAG TPA: SufD family Fe-S cluster assembly protein [Candidatus Azoamicus sp. MARI]
MKTEKYIYKTIIENKKKENIRLNIIKNYLIFYKDKKKYITKPDNDINKKIINKKYNIIKMNKCSKNIILSNNNLIKIENLKEIKVFNKINKDISNDLKNFFIDCIYSNLSINYIINNISSKNKIFIKIPKNIIIKKDIHIVNINNKKNTEYKQLYIIAEENSKIKIKNYYINNNDTSSNNININIYLKKNSTLSYKIINSNKKKTIHNNSVYSKQLENSILNITELSIKNDNIKSQKFFFLLGKNSQLKKKAAYILNTGMKCDIQCKINHYENESKSTTIVKTTNKNSNIIFKANIEVAKGIEKTQSHLKCNGLMLSKKGSIEFIPELSINNNNVICSHAATIGYIDKNVIKYMQSRGIKENDCINKLIKIFFNEILND